MKLPNIGDVIISARDKFKDEASTAKFDIKW